MWAWSTLLLPRKSGAHSGLMTQVISASGYASRRSAAAGKVCTMSPRELGLMMRMEEMSGFKIGSSSRVRTKDSVAKY